MGNIKISADEKSISKRIEEINEVLNKFHEEESKNSPELSDNPYFYIGAVNSMLIRRIAELEVKFEKHYHLDSRTLLRR